MLNEEIKIDVPLVLTPEQIYDYMHEEHTPYSSMSKEEGKAHICGLIYRFIECKKIILFQKDMDRLKEKGFVIVE